jgi:CheY-like chemotaxis protein
VVNVANASATRQAPTSQTSGVHSPPTSSSRLQVLIADATPERWVDALREAYAPVVERSVSSATRRLSELRPEVVIADLALPDGDGIEICRLAKALPRPPLVMVTTPAPERVPAALIVGCNSVLLKPYSASLLCTRIGRLLQLSARAATIRRAVHREDIAVAVRASPVDSVTTNQVWSDIRCPGCARSGATSFDFVSRRRMWCACLACEHVWMAPRRE